MKIKIRFMTFFTLGLFLFLLYISLVVGLLLEVILPYFDIPDNPLIFIIVFLAVFISGGMLFSFWFLKPLTVMILLINQMSEGHEEETNFFEKIMTKKRMLKKQYWLYRELINDIHTLKERLTQSKIQREKLEQAKQEWVRGISHDIKTPLSYVIGYSSLLMSTEHSWTWDEQQSFLSLIHQNGMYISNLVNNLNLTFRIEVDTKPLPLQLSTFDLIAFLKQLITDTLKKQSSEIGSLVLQTPESELNIEADQHLLYRAIINLIGNAIQHNTPGTKITITVKRDGECGIVISIQDNGKGMTVDGIFDKYHDTQTSTPPKNNYVSGLGLFIVKGIIEAHGGEISAASKINEGTTFIMRIPLKHDND